MGDNLEAISRVREAVRDGYPKKSILCGVSPKPYEGEHLRALGEEAMKKGSIAVLMPAGGLSTRMGGVNRLGLPIGPVSKRSIVQLQLQKMSAVRKRYRVAFPLVVVTSDGVHTETMSLFERNGYFGFPEEDIRFIKQDSMPVIDNEGNGVTLPNGLPLVAPTGHGGIVAAIDQFDIIHWLSERGVEHLFQFQYPNVMEVMCDAAFVGAHLSGEHDATVKGINEVRPSEKMGRICMSNAGRMRIAEYYELENAAASDRLHSLPANMGTYLWRIDFLRRFIQSGLKLPFVPVRYRHPDTTATMWKVEQFIFDLLDVRTTNRLLERLATWKVEQFIFDLLDYTDSSGFVLVEREEHYGIVKHPSGADSLESAGAQLNRNYLRWLAAAGAISDGDDPVVEISPLFALDRDELVEKIPRGFRFASGLILEQS